MEFLVRLEDKINTMVICLNPVHTGKLMGRVIYDDPTFTAACPDCSSAEYLYRKNNAEPKQGHFITFKEDGLGWGGNELKHKGIVRIDCTYEQAQEWCQSIGESRITSRFRKYFFDFEAVLTPSQVKNWKDMNVYSDIISIPDEAKSQIKEMQWP